ncbi:MAG: ABC transporter substrate-binding protein [Verrucomicrobia bacterium]|nr:ABC transporter substrate-binding protein [Verrucomicrobiota bacterium]
MAYLGIVGIVVLVFLASLVILLRRTPEQLPIQISLVSPLSGPQENRGKKALDAVLLKFSDVNREGGIQGHPLKVIPYDDAGKPEVAVEKAKQIAASPAVTVIGHLTSATSSAAGQIYKAAAIPAITALAVAPGITANNPYYFRIAIDNSTQGHILAAYARNVLGQKRARIIYSDEPYGKSLEAAFADEFVDEGGIVENQWSWEPEDTEKQHAALIQQASEEIANGESGVVFVAVTYNQSHILCSIADLGTISCICTPNFLDLHESNAL